jgi:LuxR family maltose regulon positive regulatory protein
MRRVIESLILQAITYQQRDSDEPAMQAFERALILAEPEGYIRTFLDEGQPVTQLLHKAIASGHSPVYARRLLAEFARQGRPSTAPVIPNSSAQGLAETLSDRELEVLGLIAKGLTNKEIGMRLNISLSTVKGHTTNIYGKLGVKSRTQAVTLAQSLSLIT